MVPSKEAWQTKLQRLFSELPLVLSDSDLDAQKARDAGLQEIRCCIASRWQELASNRESLGESRCSDLRQATWVFLQSCVEAHGADIAFAPWPALSGVSASQEAASPQSGTSTSARCSSQSGSPDKGSNAAKLLSHSIKFLQTNSGVWTVFKVAGWPQCTCVESRLAWHSLFQTKGVAKNSSNFQSPYRSRKTLTATLASAPVPGGTA